MFWEAYPKKIGRKEAKRAWNKNLCDGHILEVLESLDAWKKTDQWREVQFIQYPATWLNKELFKEKPKNASTITGGENLYERAKRMEREAGISKRPH